MTIEDRIKADPILMRLQQRIETLTRERTAANDELGKFRSDVAEALAELGKFRSDVAEALAEIAELRERISLITDNEKAEVELERWDAGHSGAGWYWYYSEYPEEKSNGSYLSCSDAVVAIQEPGANHMLSEHSTLELAKKVDALEAERDEALANLGLARERLRRTAQILIEGFGAVGPENAEEAAARAASELERLRALIAEKPCSS